ncbi:spore germination protein [Clostridium sp. SYSU_GA19001]|uniref:GerAB/ArcD/ProY family transporter n=1 Tax=Clostridium caldaquaticum TaxID=2940653 RepID=UPI002077790B|nr:endospore germination permease [Clostridium caldaquaticum]MCM8709507.1 spore germination protein [Clostridium caldaquaticum]
MKDGGKISQNQIRTLIILSIAGTAMLDMPGTLALEIKQDAWIAAVIGVIGGVFIANLYNRLAAQMSNMTLMEYSEKVMGKWLGALFSIFFLIFLVLNCSRIVYMVGNFMTTQIMPETSMLMMNVLILIPAVIGTRLGLEPIARSAEVFFPWILTGFILMAVFAFLDIKLINIQPIFESGVKPVLWSVILFESFTNLTVIVFLMFYPVCAGNLKEAGRAFSSGVLIAGIMIMIQTILCILSLEPYGTVHNVYPSYILAKNITVGRQIERLESIIAMVWIISIYYKINLYFYAAALGITQIFKLRDYKSLTIPLAILVVYFSLIIYPNSVYYRNWDTTTWVSHILTNGLFIPVLLLILGKVTNKKKENTNNGEG